MKRETELQRFERWLAKRKDIVWASDKYQAWLGWQARARRDRGKK